MDTQWSWIGLTDDPKSWKTMGNDINSWRWSVTGETGKTSYYNFAMGEPNYGDGKQECVVMTTDGRWADERCTNGYQFVCFTDANPEHKDYIFILNPLSWKAAQAYCREHHTDLAIIESAQENNDILSVKADPSVWIGLYRIPWKWEDKSPTFFKNWQSGRPNNYLGRQHCMAENTLHEWDDADCSSKLTFICQEGPKVKIKVKIKIQTDADMTDPAFNTQIQQQLHVALTNHNLTDFTLRWDTLPRKQEKHNNIIDFYCGLQN
ncbi:hypothetical protein LDENG_00239180 [Lucifuga dentata]|nr:hypothetical protein LDENG_00239180 [Lucifuga dentata]